MNEFGGAAGRILGQNPLASLVIHHIVEDGILTFVPRDAPLWSCTVGLAVFFGIVHLFVRHPEWQNISLRL